MISRRISRCNLCGKEIVTKGNWFNQIFIHQLNDWAVEVHMRKEHGRGWMKKWYLLLSVMEIFAGVLIQLVMLILWIVTLPFWVIHEFCSLN